MEKKIINYLVESNQVVVLYRTDGEYHLVIGVWSRSIWEFENFWGVFKEKFGQYFSKYHSSVMTKYFEFSRLYFIQTSEDKAQFATIRKADVEKLDELDFKLLGLLSNNARASLVEVAKKLKISIVTARYRLRSLMDKKVILGFRPILNLRKLGQEYYKVDLWFRKFDHVNEISQVILSHPNVICTERTIITSDLEFDVEIGNFGKFIDMMDSFKAKFPDDIKEYTYYSRIDNLKTNYMPSFLSIGEK
jgi:DNA-binding Lrp family transcriptional regulator